MRATQGLTTARVNDYVVELRLYVLWLKITVKLVLQATAGGQDGKKVIALGMAESGENSDTGLSAI